jgi:hypothetical protein
MWPTTDFGPRLPHKTGIAPKFRFDETQACQPVRPAGLQPAERNQNLSAGQPVKGQNTGQRPVWRTDLGSVLLASAQTSSDSDQR